MVVLEANRRHLGGISRTVEHNGFRCDIGGHRFFSKSAEVNRLWEEILGDDLIQRERKSRIFYRGKFFDYPLKAGNVLRGLGLAEAALCFLSFAWAQMRPAAEAASFVAKTLIDSLRYPRQGPGMMWEAAGDRIRKWGGEIRMGRRVAALARSGDSWEVVSRREGDAGAEGDELRLRADFAISSAPIRDLMAQFEPSPPPEVARAA